MRSRGSLLAVALAASSVRDSAAFAHPRNAPTSCRANRLSAAAEASLDFDRDDEGPPLEATAGFFASLDDGDEGPPREPTKGFFASFFEELDAFVDDATSRRLGAGAQYYGKRRSNFYGEADANRKRDKNVSDATEDYNGPSNAGYFKWVPDPETGELKPVTRLKEVNIEKKTRYKA